MKVLRCTRVMRNNTRVHLVAQLPLPIIYGGLEVQCLQTWKALSDLGIDACLLNYHQPSSDVQLLHLFGNPPSIYELCLHTAKTKKLIISAVCSARGPARFSTVIRRGMAGLAALVRERTNYSRQREAFGMASRIICLNDLERRYIHSAFGIPWDRLVIIPNGVEDNLFSADPKPFVEAFGIQDFILYTGNIVSRKGPLRLARALKQLEIPGVFIGGTVGAEKEYADAFAAEIQASKYLRWIPALPHDSPLLASAYAAARVFCLPSEAETQSLSALEAMAAGTPIILANRPYAHQAPFQRALLCEPRDENDLGRALRVAYTDPERFRIPLPNEFRWREVARQVAEVYEQVLELPACRT